MLAQRLPAVRGIQWLSDGFALYRRNPPLLTMLTMSFLIIVAAFGIIQPFGQFLLPLALPALTAIVANGCRALEHARTGTLELKFEMLTRGLIEHKVLLVHLGFLHLAGMLIVLGIDLGLEHGGVNLSFDLDGDAAQLARMLRLMALAVPLLLAFWFAPLLTAWDGIPAAKSLFFSFVAAWRNWRAFVAYGFAVTLIGVFLPTSLVIGATFVSVRLAGILSFFLQGALLLVFAPVLMATVYLSYRDVFVPASGDA
jgi:hypothetical protein